jgi:hypothetical protein
MYTLSITYTEICYRESDNERMPDFDFTLVNRFKTDRWRKRLIRLFSSPQLFKATVTDENGMIIAYASRNEDGTTTRNGF